MIPEPAFHEIAESQGTTVGEFARSNAFRPETHHILPLTNSKNLPISTYSGRRAILAQFETLRKSSDFDSESLRREMTTLLDSDSTFTQVQAAEILTQLDGISDEAAMNTLFQNADIAISGPYTALHALDAISRVTGLTENYLNQLKALNVPPPRRLPRKSPRIL